MLQARLQPITDYDDWIESMEFRDSDTGDLFDFTGASTYVAVRRIGESSVTTVASTDDGNVTYPDTGIIHVQVLYGEYAFEPGEYDVRLTITRDGFQTSLIVGTLPVVDGLKP